MCFKKSTKEKILKIILCFHPSSFEQKVKYFPSYLCVYRADVAKSLLVDQQKHVHELESIREYELTLSLLRLTWML